MIFRLQRGFTLIELSIVLVVIGLIVGGILVGRDLINATEVRATITQIEKYNQAVNTFYEKYGGLPGDLPNAYAGQFGFTPRGAYPGQGDGNGVIEGNVSNTETGHYGWVEGGGETVMFWVDLTYANGLNLNLIEGNFSVGTPNTVSSPTGTTLATFFPQAKIGNGNYFYIYSNTNGGAGTGNSINYFGLSAVTAVSNAGSCGSCIDSSPGLTVKQAYDIDIKIDDGLPTSGRIIAQYIDGVTFGGIGNAPHAASPSSATCYDTTSGNYSITQSNGNNVNCALSFRIQGAGR